MLRTMAAASRNEECGGLFKDGLKSVAVGLAYGVVPFLVAILTFVVPGSGAARAMLAACSPVSASSDSSSRRCSCSSCSTSFRRR
nr:DUF4013 domain-containing protein [Haladaptatus salinisoli]